MSILHSMNPITRLTYRNIFISVDKVTYSWQLVWPASWIYIVGFSLSNLMSSQAIEISGYPVPYYTFIAIGMMTFNAMNTSEVSGSIIWKDKRNEMFQQLFTMRYSVTQYIISNLVTIVILGIGSSASNWSNRDSCIDRTHPSEFVYHPLLFICTSLFVHFFWLYIHYPFLLNKE